MFEPKRGSRFLRFDTTWRRFMSIWWLTGVPFFLFRCFLSRNQIWRHPSYSLVIVIRGVVDTFILWFLNEMISRAVRKGKR